MKHHSSTLLAAGVIFAVLVSVPAFAQIEGAKIIVTSDQDIIATYRGNTAAYNNDLYLFSPDNNLGLIFQNHVDSIGATFNLGSFPIGTELIFQLHVNDTGYDFFSGPAERNPDDHAHARVTYDWQPDETLVEFEDLYNGPFNYNDLSFSFTGTPEPASALLLGAGVLLLRRWR